MANLNTLVTDKRIVKAYKHKTTVMKNSIAPSVAKMVKHLNESIGIAVVGSASPIHNITRSKSRMKGLISFCFSDSGVEYAEKFITKLMPVLKQNPQHLDIRYRYVSISDSMHREQLGISDPVMGVVTIRFRDLDVLCSMYQATMRPFNPVVFKTNMQHEEAKFNVKEEPFCGHTDAMERVRALSNKRVQDHAVTMACAKAHTKEKRTKGKKKSILH